MSIIIKAKNIGTIRAVAIDTGDRTVTKISGRNGAGKSTVLKIFDYLADTRSIPPEPIRKGAEKGEAEVWFDSGEGRIQAKLKFSQSNKRGSLSIQTEHGRPIRNPKEFLKSVFGPFSFNPTTFMDLPEKEQMETLVQALAPDITSEDVSEIVTGVQHVERDPGESGIEYADRVRRAMYERRREANYDVADSQKRFPEGWTPDEEPVPPSNIAELLDAQQKWSEYFAVCDSGNAATDKLDLAEKRVAEIEQALVAARAAVDVCRRELREIEDAADRLAATLPSMSEVEIRSAIADAEAVTKARHTWEDRVAHHKRWQDASALSQSITDAIAQLDTLKRTRLAEAAAAIGVEGLGIHEDGILYRGLPLKQACGTAEGIILSFQIMAALNPALRLLRIDDANLLSPSSVDVIEGLAQEHGYQVLMAYVDDDGSEGGIYIEDGEVVADEYDGGAL